MRKIFLLGFVVVFLVGGVLGGEVSAAAPAGSPADTVTGRQPTVCEGANNRNYFEVDASPIQSVVLFGFPAMIRANPIVDFASLMREAAPNLSFPDLCTSSNFSRATLDSVWAVLSYGKTSGESGYMVSSPVVPSPLGGFPLINHKWFPSVAGLQNFIPLANSTLFGFPLTSNLKTSGGPYAPHALFAYVFEYEFEKHGSNTAGGVDIETRRVTFYVPGTDFLPSVLKDENKKRILESQIINELNTLVADAEAAGGELNNLNPERVLYTFYGGDKSALRQGTIPTLSCLADVDKDGKVNIADLVSVARFFGRSVAPGNLADVNGDKRVNIIDLVTVASKFGQTAEQCVLAATGIPQPGAERVVFVPVPVARQSQNAGFASVLKSIFWVIGN